MKYIFQLAEPKCRTTKGTPCLFPVIEDGYEYSFCRKPQKNQISDIQPASECPTFQGRSVSANSNDIEQPINEDCDETACSKEHSVEIQNFLSFSRTFPTFLMLYMVKL